MQKNELKVMLSGLVLVVSLSSCTTPIIGSANWPSGCFRDSSERVREMETIIQYRLDHDLINATVNWIREVDAECEAWKKPEKSWYEFWDKEVE